MISSSLLCLCCRFCFHIMSVQRFLSAFYVLPSKCLTIYDHFLLPLLSRMQRRRRVSYYGIHGPFLRLGLTQQFQCSRHCLAFLKILSSFSDRKQSSWLMSFQSLVSFLPQLPISWTNRPRRADCSGLQLLVARLTFLRLSHLNMQDSPETPGMREAMASQSSSICIMGAFTRCFSTSLKPRESAYLETIQMSICTSSSLQFFFMRLFLAILGGGGGYFSMRRLISLRIISSLRQLSYARSFLELCSQ